MLAAGGCFIASGSSLSQLRPIRFTGTHFFSFIERRTFFFWRRRKNRFPQKFLLPLDRGGNIQQRGRRVSLASTNSVDNPLLLCIKQTFLCALLCNFWTQFFWGRETGKGLFIFQPLSRINSHNKKSGCWNPLSTNRNSHGCEYPCQSATDC